MQTPSKRKSASDQDRQSQTKHKYSIKEYLDFDNILYHFHNLHPDVIAEFAFFRRFLFIFDEICNQNPAVVFAHQITYLSSCILC